MWLKTGQWVPWDLHSFSHTLRKFWLPQLLPFANIGSPLDTAFSFQMVHSFQATVYYRRVVFLLQSEWVLLLLQLHCPVKIPSKNLVEIQTTSIGGGQRGKRASPSSGWVLPGRVCVSSALFCGADGGEERGGEFVNIPNLIPPPQLISIEICVNPIATFSKGYVLSSREDGWINMVLRKIDNSSNVKFSAGSGHCSLSDALHPFAHRAGVCLVCMKFWALPFVVLIAWIGCKKRYQSIQNTNDGLFWKEGQTAKGEYICIYLELALNACRYIK